MREFHPDLNNLLATLVEHLDVPKSYYELAANRHRSLGEWLHRDESLVAQFAPDVRPQGSFRYGTVIRPINKDDDYDLDNVCLLRSISKSDITQANLKELYGNEIKSYAKAHNMIAPVEEHNRCWRLQYADQVNFHLDTLPCIPDDEKLIGELIALSVPELLAKRSIAITDRKHPDYQKISPNWLSSNPRGFARWFEERAALGRSSGLIKNSAKASVEDVPAYEWKTTLQRSIQILKRHRDVMFFSNMEIAPISMIITNLSARAYNGEQSLSEALFNILDRMPNFVRSESPRVPNPANPAEDYADKWKRDHRLEQSFWQWHAQATNDVTELSSFLAIGNLERNIKTMFKVNLTEDELNRFTRQNSKSSTVAKSAPSIFIPAAQKPWGSCG